MSDQARSNTTVRKDRTYPPGYGVVEPVANYRPWDIDAEFCEVYELVRDSTMVDIYRLWTLWFVAGQLPPGDVLEIGSWRGGSGTLIGRAIARDGAAPARKLYLADTFAGVVKAGPRDTYYKGGEHANTSEETVRELLGRAGVTNVELLPGIFPDDRGAEIADRRFALCHIDVDVYQSAADCFAWAWPRMAAGGVIVFDDFGFYGCEGVTAFVHEIAGRQGETGRVTAIPSLSGQAVVVKAASE